MRRLIASSLVVALLSPSLALAGVDSKGAAYFGGTLSPYTGSKGPVEGTINTQDDQVLIFTATVKEFRGTNFSIPYTSFIDIEYGQKAGRRVGATIGMAALLGPIGLLTLFSKKRNHYLTIGYTANDKEQVAVIEIGKDLVRTTLPILEARSGKKIVYQDEEAKKNAK